MFKFHETFVFGNAESRYIHTYTCFVFGAWRWGQRPKCGVIGGLVDNDELNY
jgi:hypothetical protein